MKRFRLKENKIDIPADFGELLEAIKAEFTEMLRVNLSMEPFSEKEKRLRIKRREEVREALRNCGSGDEGSKIFIKDYIKRIMIGKYGINEVKIDQYIEMNSEFQFKIMLSERRETYGKEALERLIGEYFSSIIERRGKKEITGEDVEGAYLEEGITAISYPQKVEYLCQKIYESYKGNGVVDEILGMTVDGISGGVSGSEGKFNVWIMYKGNTISLAFLVFDGEKEIKRICRNLCKGYGIGQISERKGYVVAEMRDGSRVSIARPPFCETWTFFVRKFRLEKVLEMEDIVRGEGSEMLIQLLRYLVIGERLICISGEQGSGKTSLLAAMINFIPEHLNIRVSEMSFELHLRKRFPKRNIVSFKETDSIGIQEGLDYTKKTDGNVTIIGEVASMPAVIFLVQVAQNASSFTLFTHHAKDTGSLIHYFRNALLMQGNFQNERVALIQAVNSIHFNIKLGKGKTGERYIEKITEIIPKEGEMGFLENDIVVRRNGSYVKKGDLSRNTKEEIYRHLDEKEQEIFLKFFKTG